MLGLRRRKSKPSVCSGNQHSCLVDSLASCKEVPDFVRIPVTEEAGHFWVVAVSFVEPAACEECVVEVRSKLYLRFFESLVSLGEVSFVAVVNHEEEVDFFIQQPSGSMLPTWN